MMIIGPPPKLLWATGFGTSSGTGDRPRTPPAAVPGAAWCPCSWRRDGRYAQLMWVPDVPNGKPRSWRSGEPLWPANDIDTAAEKSARTCWHPQGDLGVMRLRRQAGA